MSQIIKISSNGQMELIEWDEALSYEEKNRKIVSYIGNGCEYYELVFAKRLADLAKGHYVLLIDEEGKLKENNINVIASYLYGNMMYPEIVGNALIARLIETEEGYDIAGIENINDFINAVQTAIKKTWS